MYNVVSFPLTNNFSHWKEEIKMSILWILIWRVKDVYKKFEKDWLVTRTATVEDIVWG